MAKKILVIDDEELIIKSLRKLLEKNGFGDFPSARASSKNTKARLVYSQS